MNKGVYVFPSVQAGYLRVLRQAKGAVSRTPTLSPSSFSLRSAMPPVYSQALRGTCVSNAVVALLEYYSDCKIRFSVQYLHEATKQFERAGVEKNLEAVRNGGEVHPAFESAYHNQLLQLKMIYAANPDDASATTPFFEAFAEGVRSRVMDDSGTLLRSCFRVLETRGVCRHVLWPYSPMSGTSLSENVIEFPPGTDEDARKHRFPIGLYFLRSPKNVDEIRGIIAGSNARRPMPVCITLDYFEGCESGEFKIPEYYENEEGQIVSLSQRKGMHGLLVVGYVDDKAWEGGGYFIVRNSWGQDWGDKGYGKVSYAYVECFASEAGTILQDLIDYHGDGYGGMNELPDVLRKKRFRKKVILNILAAIGIALVTILVGKIFNDPLNLHSKPQNSVQK
jgi:hypothetical protein